MFLISWLAFFALWAVLVRYGLRVRVALLAAQVVNGVLIVLVTETLSVFQAVTIWPLMLFWSAVLLTNLILLYRLRARPAMLRSCVPLDAVELVILAAVGLIVIVTGVIALVAPPNNYDSMIYHMARVAHWAYNATVANYPTNTLLQLVIPPFSEFAILQGYIMSGADYFANLVQWNSMVASLVGVSLVAELLGGSRRAQLLAVLFAATLPMGILQASSTQNDYVATLWAVCVAVFAMLLITTGKWRWGILCAFGFGLATFTKGIAVILGLPFAVWALGKVRWSVGKKIALGLLVVGIVLAINAGFLQRQLQLSAQPFRHMASVGGAVVERVDIRGLASNAVRGIATALDVPSADWHSRLFNLVERTHLWLGLDINDPRFTVPGSTFATRHCAFFSEEYATSALHTIVYLLVIVYIIISANINAILGVIRRDTTPSPEGRGWLGDMGWLSNRLLQFVAVFIIAVLLYCSLVRWHESISRFHLPFFVLFSAVAGVVVSNIFTRPLLLLCVWMFIAAMLPLFNNQQRSVISYGAVQKSSLESSVYHGGEIFDWLVRNGFLIARDGGKGYLQDDITDNMWERLRQTYPAQYPQIWIVLNKAPSFKEGLWGVQRQELLFARFGKISRDEIGRNLKFMRQQLRMHPACKDIGYIKGGIQYEYPLWSILNSDGRLARIENIRVDNASRSIPYPRGAPEPCLIIKEGLNEAWKLEYKGRIYLRCTSGPLQVYVDSGIAPPGCVENSAPTMHPPG